MCLKNARKFDVPQGGIVVYKVFKREKGTESLDSPFYFGPLWSEGCTYRTKIAKPAMDVMVDAEGGKVSGGAFHSFLRVEDAFEFCKFSSRYVVAKCIIPWNTNFAYYGETSVDGTKSFASESLTVVELLNKEENVPGQSDETEQTGDWGLP